MAYVGEFAALVTAVCWSLTAIFFSYSGRLVGSNVVNRSRLLFALIFISLTHYLIEGALFPFDAELFRWGWLALSSILGLVLGDTFLFQAYVLVGPRLSMLMMSSVPIISTLLAWLFLGERLRGVELLGIFLAVAGIAWVVTERSGDSPELQNRSYILGLLLGLLGALGQASNLIFAKLGLVGGFSPISATSIRILVALVILWTIAGLRRQIRLSVMSWRKRNVLPTILAGTIVGPFLGIWFSLIAVQLAPVGIASTLMALSPVILIPLSYLIYKEKITLRAALGTIFAFAGVTFIFLSS
jgi:drug/metabolite transporter (DMT)-like permease